MGNLIRKGIAENKYSISETQLPTTIASYSGDFAPHELHEIRTPYTGTQAIYLAIQQAYNPQKCTPPAKASGLSKGPK